MRQRFGWDRERRYDAGRHVRLGWDIFRRNPAYEPETLAYAAAHTMTDAEKLALDLEIKAIKAGVPLTLTSPFCSLAIPTDGSAQFVTGANFDTTRYNTFWMSLTDSGSKQIILQLLSAGSAETASENQLSNGSFGTGDPPTGWTGQGSPTLASVTDSISGGSDTKAMAVTSGTQLEAAYQTVAGVFNVGMLMKLTGSKKSAAGYTCKVRLRYGSGANDYKDCVSSGSTSWVTGSGYATYKDAATAVCAITEGQTARFDEYDLVRVTAPSATGEIVKVVAMQAGFNPMSATFTGNIQGNSLGRATGGNVLTIGDSKTLGDLWQRQLISLLWFADVSTRYWQEYPTVIATGGATVASRQSTIDADLLAAVGIPDYVLIDLGANDAGSLPAEATWKANYQYIIDAIHSKWAGAKIYLSKPWRRGLTANCGTIAGWIDALVASNSSFVYVGDDQQVWLENGDDGATYTSDGTHFNTAGDTAKAAQLKAILMP